MKKLLLQFALILGSIALTWFALSRINYTDRVAFKELSKASEEKIGNIIYDFIKNTEHEIEPDSLKEALIKIKDRICKNNKIDQSQIKIHILDNAQINAFALPDGHMIIFSGLIEYCKNPEELGGVMAHELAHMENNHIVKRISREFGLAILVSMGGGDATNEILKEVVKYITSTAFARAEETEADKYAVRYLAKASIDPKHFANFLFRLSREEPAILEKLEWISTHPNTKDRIAEILKLKDLADFEIRPIMEAEEWETLRDMK